MRRVLVLGATGGTGRHLARELLDRGVETRVASRDPEHLAAAFGDTEATSVVADAGRPDQVREAVAGCDALFHCVGLPPGLFHRHVELARVVTAAAREEGARPFLLSSYWSYGPLPDRPVGEDHPPSAAVEHGVVRRRQEEVFLEAGGAVAVLPDFFGPLATLSILDDALAPAAEGSTVFWPGDPDAARDFLFLPDLGPILCDLASRDECWGKRWNVPGSGARPPRELLGRVSPAEHSPRVFAIGRWTARLVGLFDAEVRAFAPLLPLYESPVRLDGSRLTALLGRGERTPYERALPAAVRAHDTEGS